MFQMMTYAVTALKSIFITFKKEGFSSIQNKNVSVATCHLEAITISSNEVNDLVEEEPLHILEGLTIFFDAFSATYAFQNKEKHI